MLKTIRNLTFALLSSSVMADTVDSINEGRQIEVSGFNCADESIHMIEWLGLGKDYQSFLVKHVETELYNQQPGSQLLELKCTGKPELLTGALPQDGDKSKAILTRFSATFPLEATVNLGGSVWLLTIDQNYYAENLNIPSERKLTQNFNVKSSAQK